ncbi:NAD(P)/FAD-dependent oxidoreductase [Pseudogemmobacter humi]|uniref:Hydrogen cyanide synthase subunit HcnC n=1 Tax=Pseudogemmobacter humi TaxID=2483812 RepID=A0A3P5XCU8_9RHOB|nr:FAD-binding oxidoreductase [Pseudogemmobacter humi]VDC28674.1 Hydrogen cyanide synthase subunit HcnC precursor [Pseudogemmobacter humi]
MTATDNAKVVIIGGAIIGSFCAWFLRENGFRGEITVVEKDPSYRFSSTALSAASIRTQFETPLCVAMSLFGVEFIRGLKARYGSDGDIGYVEAGYLILHRPGDAAARLDMLRMQNAHGADIIAFAPGDLPSRFPFLNSEGLGLGTFGQSGEGWFDAWSLLSLIRREARRLGVRYVEAEASGLEVRGDHVTGVALAGGEILPCDWCVNAAGALAARPLEGLGIALPVSPRKRTVFNFRAPVEARGFPMLYDVSGFWIRPEGEGFIGGIKPPADPDATGDFTPDHALLEDLLWPLLAARIPAMEQLRPDRCWAGHYEINALDHNGIVGPHDRIGNLIFATGFSGHGVMHSPATGRAVAELIVHGGFRTLDLTPLGWERVRDARPLATAVSH